MKKLLRNLNCTLFATKSNCTAIIALIALLTLNNSSFAKPVKLFTQLTAATFTVAMAATTGLKQ